MSSRVSSLGNFIKKAIVHIIFISYSISVLVFVAILIITPLRTGKDVIRGILKIPNSFTFENFISIWNSGLNIGFRNSMFFGIVTCVLTIVIGGIAAYGFAFIKFRFKNVLYTFMFSGIFISTILILIPLFIQYRDLHLVNTFVGVLIIYTGVRLPFTIYLYRNYFEEFPMSIFEAAKIDGASEIGIFSRIILPLSKAVTITVILFNFISVWVDLLIGLLFLQKVDNQVIMFKIINIFTGQARPTQLTPLAEGFAGLFISTVPVIILYSFTKKYYIQGLTLGSVK
jgi:raffinose/stachyose/melibiose transport system permease protein